jgi:glucose-1-phosphate adenylyltransferase
MNDTLAVILGGGAGTRLFPLTLLRSKPAVPLGGKYRLIDVPASNCINAGINRIFILTQYNSASLNNHISQTYRFSHFSKGFVNVLAATQTPTSQAWFQGTADAVRQALPHLESHPFKYLLVLSGDHLYHMNYLDLVAYHREVKAEITVATTPVDAEDSSGFGIMKTGPDQRITRFVEKPPRSRLEGLDSDTGPMRDSGRVYLASMGIYVFNRDTLFETLTRNTREIDFGHEIIPAAIPERAIFSYRFDDYWADIGTIKAYYQANIDLGRPNAPINMFDPRNPIFTNPRMLPPAKLQGCHAIESIVAEGASIDECRIERSVVGIRSIIGSGTTIRDCVINGADYYETADEKAHNRERGVPNMGIGRNCRIERAIIDKNARIGEGVVIRDASRSDDRDESNHFVRDGIVIIPKGAIVPDGTVL